VRVGDKLGPAVVAAALASPSRDTINVLVAP